MNKTPSERVAVVGAIDPDVHTADTYYTGYIPMKNFRRFMAVVMAGTLGTNATVNAKLIAYTSAAGAGALDVPGAAITQLTEAGTDSDKQAVINFDTSILAGSTLYTHFRLSLTLGTATSDLGAIVFGLDPLYAPASDNDATTVDEIVTV